VQGVAAKAGELAAVLPEDQRSAVVAAAWLHDIGYSPDLARTGLHPLDGAAYLASLGDVDPVVIALVGYHTGALIKAGERGLAEQLRAYPAPPPQLLDVLTTADVLTGPDGAPVTPEQRVTEILRRYPATDPVHRAVARSGPELVAMADRLLRLLSDVRAASGGVERVADA